MFYKNERVPKQPFPPVFILKRGHILHIFRYAPDISEHWVGIEFSGKFTSWAIWFVLLSISNGMQSISPLFIPLSFLIFHQPYMILTLSFWFISVCTKNNLHTTYINHTYVRNTTVVSWFWLTLLCLIPSQSWPGRDTDKACRMDVG